MSKVEKFNLVVTTTLNILFILILIFVIAVLIVAVHTYIYIHSKIEYITDKIDDVENITKIIRNRLPF